MGIAGKDRDIVKKRIKELKSALAKETKTREKESKAEAKLQKQLIKSKSKSSNPVGTL